MAAILVCALIVIALLLLLLFYEIRLGFPFGFVLQLKHYLKYILWSTYFKNYCRWVTASGRQRLLSMKEKKINVLFRDVEGRQNFACDRKTSSFH